MYGRTRARLVALAWMALAGCGDSESRSDWTTLVGHSSQRSGLAG